MNSSSTQIPRTSANYSILAPLSMSFAAIAIIISIFTLVLISLTRQLRTVTHLLTCNTCTASILYCLVQCINYIYILFIKWDTSDQSCRWRGYFGYMSIVAVIYSYLLQAISRFFFAVLSTRYRWLTSLKTHFYLIFIGWTVVLFVPLPALLTKDIYFRAGFLCWVPKAFILHAGYTLIVYYVIPIILIISLYVSIYIRMHYGGNTATAQQGHGRRSNRDLEVFRNIMILFGIYIIGAVPTVFYILTGIEIFYSMAVVTLTFTVVIEKLVTLFLYREIRNILKKYFPHSTSTVVPSRT